MTESMEGEAKLRRPLPVLQTAAAVAAANDLYLIWRTTVQSLELLPPMIYLSVLGFGDVLYNVFCMEVSLRGRFNCFYRGW